MEKVEKKVEEMRETNSSNWSFEKVRERIDLNISLVTIAAALIIGLTFIYIFFEG